ncbi:hypothetical protein [Roseibium sp.]|uniref:hypothetical protein n=1 Tax=Roseibium sp. TaxID=1936156 RepID=UPI003BAB4C6D
MTAAVYNFAGEARIPAYVWTAVLGVSVAAHIALVVYGISLTFTEDAQDPDVTQTEIVIESDDLVFETAEAVQSTIAEAAQSDVADAVQPAPAPVQTPIPPELVPQSSALAELPPVQPAPQAQISPEAVEVQPTVSEAVSPPEAETVVSSAAALVPETIEAGAAAVAPAASPDAGDIEAAPRVSAEAVSSAPVEAVIAAVPETVEAFEQDTIAAVSPPTIIVPETPAPVTVPETVPENLQPNQSGADDAALVTAAEPAQSIEVAVVPAGPQPVQVAPVVAPSAVAPSDVTGSGPVESVAANSGPEAVVVASDPQAVASVSPGDVVIAPTTRPAESAAIAAGTPVDRVESAAAPAVTASPAQIVPETVEVPTVAPAEQQLAAVQPSEIVSPSLLPTEPNLPNIPPTPVVGGPEPRVPAQEAETTDPLTEVTDYVSGYDIGACAQFSVVSAGTKTAQIVAFGADFPRFAEFYGRFQQDQGYEADLQVRLVSNRQCAVLDTLGSSNGVEAPGLVELTRTVVRDGSVLSGVIQRDLPIGRIAQAEASGVELNGKGPPELYLIDRDGQIHDARSYIRAETSTASIGGWSFRFPVSFPANEKDEYNLVLAIWNRPKQNQPAAFRTLPASRISSVLEKPGVYSIEAFRMLR